MTCFTNPFCFPSLSIVVPVSCLCAGLFGLTSALALAVTLAATFKHNTVLMFNTYINYIQVATAILLQKFLLSPERLGRIETLPEKKPLFEFNATLKCYIHIHSIIEIYM